MKFFTDESVENDYLLIQFKKYKNLPNGNWKEVFIDPGVYELRKRPYYSWEKNNKIVDILNSLPENHFFAADYPGDMNEQYTDEFLRKSWENAIRYCYHPNYIVTVQSRFNDYWSFTQWFDKYNELSIKSGILGIGNLCRILKLDEFMKHVLSYAFKKCKHPRIHVYGLTIRAFKFADNLARKYGIDFSTDSLKWTRACSTGLREKYFPKFNCTNKNRQEFFLEYMKKIHSKGVSLQNDYVDGSWLYD